VIESVTATSSQPGRVDVVATISAPGATEEVFGQAEVALDGSILRTVRFSVPPGGKGTIELELAGVSAGQKEVCVNIV
jgi:hypothetical protein